MYAYRFRVPIADTTTLVAVDETRGLVAPAAMKVQFRPWLLFKFRSACDTLNSDGKVICVCARACIG